MAIKEAEEGLLNLKRARLLREADSAFNVSKQADEEVKAEALEPSDVEVEPLEEEKERNYRVGSKCRFRYNDGRWYDGQVVALNGSDSAKISFLTPTSENMLVCTSLSFYLVPCLLVVGKLILENVNLPL